MRGEAYLAEGELGLLRLEGGRRSAANFMKPESGF